MTHERDEPVRAVDVPEPMERMVAHLDGCAAVVQDKIHRAGRADPEELPAEAECRLNVLVAGDLA